MKKGCLFLFVLLVILSFMGCAEQTEKLPSSAEPTYMLPPSEAVPLPSAELPMPTPTPSPLPIEEEGDYFDNALFVGDSIMEGIRQYVAAQRVFLLLGLNDLASDPNAVVADIVDQYSRLIANLQAASPRTEFIIITNPPKVASQWLPDYTANRGFSNQLIDEFVSALTQMCREQGGALCERLRMSQR